jgi:hypothetical protein
MFQKNKKLHEPNRADGHNLHLQMLVAYKKGVYYEGIAL